MTSTVQSPFADVVSDDWTQAEDDMLLRGVANQQSWDEISAEISDELADRSPLACRRRFERIQRMVKRTDSRDWEEDELGTGSEIDL